jgi:hypothetical protein
MTVFTASNAEYIDKNFGGVTDHLGPSVRNISGGTSAHKIRCGRSHPRSSDANPFVIAYEDLWRMLKDMVVARNWRERLRNVLGPPL